MRIFKYSLDVVDEQRLTLPAGARPLSVQLQRGELQLWALVDPEQRATEDHHLALYGTGVPIDGDPGQYLGTFQLDNGWLVLHAFDRGIAHHAPVP